MSFGVELKRHGAELLGRCPFHDDKTPSLVVSPKTNLWHCLGKCNVGGSTIDWVMKTKGVSFRHAVELLKADHSSLAAGEARVVKKGTTAKLEAPVKAEADDQEALRHRMLNPFGSEYSSGGGGLYSTISDYALFGHLSPRTVGLMSSVFVPDTAPGQRVSAGSFGWDGAFGTHFWIDPKEKIVGIMMLQTDHPNRQLDRDFQNA